MFVDFLSAKEVKDCDADVEELEELEELVVVTACGKRELAGGVGGEYS